MERPGEFLYKSFIAKPLPEDAVKFSFRAQIEERSVPQIRSKSVAPVSKRGFEISRSKSPIELRTRAQLSERPKETKYGTPSVPLQLAAMQQLTSVYQKPEDMQNFIAATKKSQNTQSQLLANRKVQPFHGPLPAQSTMFEKREPKKLAFDFSQITKEPLKPQKMPEETIIKPTLPELPPTQGKLLVNNIFDLALPTLPEHRGVRLTQKLNSPEPNLIQNLMSQKSNKREIEEATAIEFVNAIFNDNSHLRKHYKSANLHDDVGDILQKTIDMHKGATLNMQDNSASDKTLTKKQQEARVFWINFIGTDPEIRWDVFEEIFLWFLESHMILDVGPLKKVNWKNLFQNMYDNLSGNASHLLQWPKCPSILDPPAYNGPIVTMIAWMNYIDRDGLMHSVLHSISDTPTLLSEIRYQPGNTYKFFCGSWYRGGWKAGKRHGKGLMNYVNGELYDGVFVAGRRHGFGQMSGLSTTFKGEWQFDVLSGFGTIEYPDKSVFQGKWKEGMQTFGTFIWPDGSQYTGHWKDGLMAGEGIYTSKFGEIRNGSWEEGKLNGIAEYKDNEGVIMKGNWVNDKMEGGGSWITDEFTYNGEFLASKEHGRGRKIWGDGSSYEGQWAHGLMHGKGEYRWPTGEMYRGDFFDNRIEGRGRKTYLDGSVYEGQWSHGEMQGIGILSWPGRNGIEKGEKYNGQWSNSQMNGQGTMEYSDGSVYEGNWEDGVRSGTGRFVLMKPDGEEVYTGEFKNDKFGGQGTLTKSNGAYYTGHWVEGTPTGRGEMKDPDGRVFIGIFEDGKPVGKHDPRLRVLIV